MPTMFGMETEYGFGVHGSDDSLADELFIDDRKNRELNQLIADMPNLFTAIDLGRVWFENGGCAYSDMGHPEYCTPECTNPSDLVKHVAAGELILKKACEKRSENSERSLHIFRMSHDSFNGSTWGCHESYLCRIGEVSKELRNRYLPTFLATRLIYTGGGGTTQKFWISPRARYIESNLSEDTTCARGLLNLKNEPLCTNYYRLHLICGESLCSQLATYLKFGTTAIVIAMLDVGIAPKVELINPVSSCHEIAENVNLDLEVPYYGGSATAIEIQRQFLDLALEHIDEDFMPEWAPWVCRRWKEILDKLENGWEAVSDCLDWAIKYKIFKQFMDSKGYRFPLRRGTLGHVELCEIDSKFGMVGGGIFEALDKAGVLNHRIVSDEDIEKAVTEPPTKTRARIRGNFVRKYANIAKNRRRRERMLVYWDVVGADGSSSTDVIQLNDPFEYERNIEVKSLSGDAILPAEGSKVVLGRHRSVGGRTNWNSTMNEYVGKVATIVEMVGNDSSGCPTAYVDIDGGRFNWRVQNMLLAETA